MTMQAWSPDSGGANYGSRSEKTLEEQITEVEARMPFTSVNCRLGLVKLRSDYGSRSENAVYFGKLKASVN